jgi:RNA polymerase sigma-70 factor (ECF subfamily)
MVAVASVVSVPHRHQSGIFSVPVIENAPASGVCLRGHVEESEKDRIADEESRLVFGMIANDANAWREFQKRYDRLILRCITKVTKRFASIGQEDIREIYATLLVSLLANDKTKLRTFDPERGNRFSSWIGLLAIHCAYDYLRTIKREPIKEALAEAHELSSDSPDPFEQTSQRQRANMAARVLAGFSKKDRTFAALYFGEGMSPDEIAVRMNISVKTVYSKKHKIQSRLEAALGTTVAA